MAYDIVLSHEEMWMYPAPNEPNRKLPSGKHTKLYCVKRTCITERFPYYDPSLIQIPAEVRARLRPSHENILADEFFNFYFELKTEQTSRQIPN